MNKWSRTKSALSDLQNVLRCNHCKELPIIPQYSENCDHFFCENCIKKCEEFCVVCNKSHKAGEIKEELTVKNLLPCVSSMLEIINTEIESNVKLREKLKLKKDDNSVKTLRTRSSIKAKGGDAIAASLTPSPNVRKTRQMSQSSKSNKENSKVKDKISKKGINNLAKLQNVEKTTPIRAKPSRKSDSSIPSTPVIEKRNVKGETALQVASIKGDVEKVKNLLNDGADPNTKDNARWTPLHEACSNNGEEIASILLENGALINVPGNNNMTPLHDAVLSNSLNVIRLLRRWGADDTFRDLWGRTPRSLAESSSSSKELIDALNTKKDPKLKAKTSYVNDGKIVLTESGLDASDKKKLEKLAKSLKFKIVADFTPEVTHLIINCKEGEKMCERTIKYMMCVVSGKWILSSKWIDACLGVGDVVNPIDFEVEGTTSSYAKMAPKKGRENFSKMLPGLLSGCHVYFAGNFNSDEFTPSKKDLEALVKAGDGVVIQREPNPESIDAAQQTVPYHANPNEPFAKCSHYCIFNPGLQEPQLKYDMEHVKTLPLSWLYDSIDHWALIDPYSM